MWSLFHSPSFKLIMGFCWPKFFVLALTTSCELSLNLVLWFCSSDQTFCHIQSPLILGFSHKQETEFLFFISSINAELCHTSGLILKRVFQRMTHLRISYESEFTRIHSYIVLAPQKKGFLPGAQENLIGSKMWSILPNAIRLAVLTADHIGEGFFGGISVSFTYMACFSNPRGGRSGRMRFDNRVQKVFPIRQVVPAWFRY